jgi:hypothetical protein
MEIELMEDWDILTYLRLNRNWMVQSHYSRRDIESIYEIKFTDLEWEDFTDFACDKFDYMKENNMDLIIDFWLEEGEYDEDENED